MKDVRRETKEQIDRKQCSCREKDEEEDKRSKRVEEPGERRMRKRGEKWGERF